MRQAFAREDRAVLVGGSEDSDGLWVAEEADQILGFAFGRVSRAKYERRISMSCWSFFRSGEPCSWSGQRCFPSSRFFGLMTGTRSPWRQPVSFQQSSGNDQSAQRPPTKITWQHFSVGDKIQSLFPCAQASLSLPGTRLPLV